MITTNLTGLLDGARDKDVNYHIGINIVKLFAPQMHRKEMKLPEEFNIEINRKEVFKQAESELKRERARKTKKTTEKTIPLHYFPDNGNGKLTMDWGSYSGVLRTAIRRVVAEQKMMSYRKRPWWDLMIVNPEIIEFVPNGHKEEEKLDNKHKATKVEHVSEEESIPEKMKVTNRLEPRGIHRGNVAYEVIENVPIEFDVIFNSESLPTDQEVVDLFHSLEGAPFGPTKNGRIEVLNIERVN